MKGESQGHTINKWDRCSTCQSPGPSIRIWGLPCAEARFAGYLAAGFSIVTSFLLGAWLF